MALFRIIDRGTPREFVEELDRLQADAAQNALNSRNGAGDTPLMHACKTGNFPIIKLILGDTDGAAGYYPENVFTTGSNSSALVIACKKGSEAMVKLIIHAIYTAFVASDPEGLKILNFVDSDGYTAAHHACINPNKGVIAALFKHADKCPNTNARDRRFGNTPLMYACMARNDSDIVNMLLRRDANINIVNNMHETPLMYALFGKKGRVVDTLLKNGADVNKARKPDGATALHLALVYDSSDNRESAKNMIKNYGANVNLGTIHTNYTPLMIACEKSTYETVKILIENGANVNAAKRDDGFTPLIYACKREPGSNVTEIVNTLIKNGANVNTPTNGYRSTPLMWASFKGNEGAVASLLDKRADPEVKTTNGKSALNFANLGKNSKIVRLLQEIVHKKQAAKSNTRRAKRGDNPELNRAKKQLEEYKKLDRARETLLGSRGSRGSRGLDYYRYI